MASLILYSTKSSPPCRNVLLTLAAAGIEADVQEMNLRSGDHRKPTFLQMNPQHTIPTLNDNGFFIWDSHAIVTYLIDKYAKDDSLYPKDLQKRAVVNQRLHFDNASLFANLRDIVLPILYEGATEIPGDKFVKINESYKFLEQFLGDNDWLAGNTYTLADICIVASVSSLTAWVPLDNYPKLGAWVKRCENKIPGYAIANAPGAAIFHDTFAKYRSNS